ncbi:hypothetical protein NRIC_26190 [Enterococcus florum]|uniref:Uncharacterized protein n=1 Tax=Enterococcus florum TaxID=2480627 RepID=A0A4P5PEV9_9ENTE|nr:hypothetical protein NRIC_26190 [Enterococcus florum]
MAYHSGGIEGNTIALPQTVSISLTRSKNKAVLNWYWAWLFWGYFVYNIEDTFLSIIYTKRRIYCRFLLIGQAIIENKETLNEQQ